MQLHESRLPALVQEVLSKGGEACLPCNLSDSWIERMSLQLDALFIEGREGAAGIPPIDEPMALVMTILLAKAGPDGECPAPTEEQLQAWLGELHLELALEGISRLSGGDGSQATLESIFAA